MLHLFVVNIIVTVVSEARPLAKPIGFILTSVGVWYGLLQLLALMRATRTLVVLVYIFLPLYVLLTTPILAHLIHFALQPLMFM